MRACVGGGVSECVAAASHHHQPPTTITNHYHQPPSPTTITNHHHRPPSPTTKTAGYSDVHANAEVAGLPSLGLEVDALRSYVSASPNALDVDLDSEDGHDGIFFPGERGELLKIFNYN